MGSALKVAGRGGDGGITPRLSGDQTRQAVEEHAEERLCTGHVDASLENSACSSSFDATAISPSLTALGASRHSVIPSLPIM
jgi:hypothetical protein